MALQCQVCGCPLDGSKDKDNSTKYEDCSGKCKDPSSLGVSLMCPSLGCQLLSVEMHGMKNITKNCLSDPTYLSSKRRKMNSCQTLTVMAITTTECVCDSSLCNRAPKDEERILPLSFAVMIISAVGW